jgi:hypothetical protein
MAQTRTKSNTTAGSARASRGSNGSRAASRTKRSNGSKKTRSASAGTRTRAAQRRPTAPKASRTDEASSRTDEASEPSRGNAVADVLSKGKTPLLAGGAAAAGLAGGIALSRVGRDKGLSMPKLGGKRKSGPSISMPKVSNPLAKGDTARKALGATAKALGNTAVEIGKAGYRVGELTTEVRRVREQARND